MYILVHNYTVCAYNTYAFCVQSLDDPFGDDTNDIDEHGMSLLVYEDIYLALYRTDGPDAAMNLRDRVLDRYRQGRELDCYRDDLKGYDVWEAPEWWFENQQCDGGTNGTHHKESNVPV